MWWFQSTLHSLACFASESLLNRDKPPHCLYYSDFVKRTRKYREETGLEGRPCLLMAWLVTKLVSVAWHPTGGNSIHLRLNLATCGGTYFCKCTIIPFVIFRRCLKVEAKQP